MPGRARRAPREPAGPAVRWEQRWTQHAHAHPGEGLQRTFGWVKHQASPSDRPRAKRVLSGRSTNELAAPPKADGPRKSAAPAQPTERSPEARMEQEPQAQEHKAQEHKAQAQQQPQEQQPQAQQQPQEDAKPDGGAAQGDGDDDAAAGDSDCGLEMMLSEMPLASVPEEASPAVADGSEDDFNDMFLSDEQADQPSSSEAHGGGNARGAQQLEQLAAQQAPAQAAQAQAAEPTVRRSARARRPPHVRRESSCMVDSTSKLSFAHPS